MNQAISAHIPSAILKLGTKKIFSKGDHIFRINSKITHCYLILSGMVKIYIDHENGRRSILDFAGCNDWLGELSIFYNETEIKENKVLHEVQCLSFEIEELRRLCKENAEVSFWFASYITDKLLTRSYRMSEYMNYTLEERLATFILQHQQNGVYHIPHSDTAEYMNVSYRHILHVIKQYCEAGILRKEKGYVITDLDKLAEMQCKR